MKSVFFLSFFVSGFFCAQMPNIERVWLNDNAPYLGEIEIDRQPKDFKLQVFISEQNKKNDQEYFISGNRVFEQESIKIEGTVDIKKYKDQKKKGVVFGDYEIAEEPHGKFSGIYRGKFTFRFDWNDKKNLIENKKIEFKGTWTSYDGKSTYPTKWSN